MPLLASPHPLCIHLLPKIYQTHVCELGPVSHPSIANTLPEKCLLKKNPRNSRLQGARDRDKSD